MSSRRREDAEAETIAPGSTAAGTRRAAGRMSRAVRKALRDAAHVNDAARGVMLEQAALCDHLATVLHEAHAAGAPVPAQPVQYLTLTLRDLWAESAALDTPAPDDELSAFLAALQDDAAGDAARFDALGQA